MFDNLNYWAILVSGVTYWIIGGVWYAAIFTKQYQAALNFNEETKKKADKDFPKALVAHFSSGLLTSFFLANFVRVTGSSSFWDGLVCGFVVWLAIAFTINFNYFMFEKKPIAWFLINIGFFLVAFTVMGGILTVWT